MADNPSPCLTPLLNANNSHSIFFLHNLILPFMNLMAIFVTFVSFEGIPISRMVSKKVYPSHTIKCLSKVHKQHVKIYITLIALLYNLPDRKQLIRRPFGRKPYWYSLRFFSVHCLSPFINYWGSVLCVAGIHYRVEN